MSSFKPNELVLCSYEGSGDGVIYRVIEMTHKYCVKIKPIFACFPSMDVKKRKVREISPEYCTKLTLDDIRSAKYDLEALLGGEMNRDPNSNPMAELARNPSKIYSSPFCGGTSECACGCNG